MAKLAIKGHPTRGEEVIEILKMLGGLKVDNYKGNGSSWYYIITNNYIDWCHECIPESNFISFTLEEFLEKFPYKIGDKVMAYIEGCLAQFTIQDMRWNYELNKVEYKICSSWLDTRVILPYKEETIDKTNKPVFDANAQCCDIMNQLIKEETMEEELIPRIDFDKYCKDKYLLNLGNYEIKEENGKTYAVRKQFEHPKNYEECCDVLKIPNDERYIYIDVPLSYNKILKTFTQLFICRDAYWEIAGWRPTKDDDGETFSLFYNRNSDKIDKCNGLYESNAILDFPTKELREAFYENFKELINQCKELL